MFRNHWYGSAVVLLIVDDPKNGQPFLYNTIKDKNLNLIMEERNMTERQKMESVVVSIRAAGYNPYAQLTGYMTTGNAAYITRQGGARAMVRDLDRAVIGDFLTNHRRMCLG